MKVLICGSRTLSGSENVHAIALRLTELAERYGWNLETLEVIEGGAAGADTAAAWWAKARKVTHTVVPADWDAHGRKAGSIRNQEMLDLEPDFVVAFVDRPLYQSRGTADMIRRCEKAGLHGVIITIGGQA